MRTPLAAPAFTLAAVMGVDAYSMEPPILAWTLPHSKARLAVLQLGHGREAHLNPAWQRLVRNALRWAGGR